MRKIVAVALLLISGTSGCVGDKTEPLKTGGPISDCINSGGTPIYGGPNGVFSECHK
jgi:hypothetical protein